jgi:AcrR family transcriptional regulator
MKINNIQLEERIYENAKNMLLKNGIKGWNMDQLSSISGITKITLYKIIESKEKLVEKCITDYIKNIHEKISEIIMKNDPIPETLEQIINIYPKLFDSNFTETINQVFLEFPSIENSTKKLENEGTKKIINFIKLAIEKGYLRNDLEPEFIFSLFKSVIHYFIKTNNKEFPQKIKLAFNCIVFGIKKD